jgi:hypothetical protein
MESECYIYLFRVVVEEMDNIDDLMKYVDSVFSSMMG